MTVMSPLCRVVGALFTASTVWSAEPASFKVRVCLASTILPGQRQLFFPTGDNYQLCKAALLA